MDIYENINLLDCPICGGAALLEEEYGWCVYASCPDCGARTAEIGFKNEEERKSAALHTAELWNMGKVISGNPGE